MDGPQQPTEGSVSGTRLHWIWRREGPTRYRHYSVFLSRELAIPFDERVDALHFEEEGFARTIGREPEFDADEEWERPPDATAVVSEPTVERVLGEQQLPARDRTAAVLPATLRSDLEAGTVERLFLRVVPTAGADVGSVDQFDREEESIRGTKADLESTASGPGYSGPLFLYARDERNDGTTILERKAPVNVVWRRALGRTGIDLSSRMGTNGWRGYYNYSRATRYAIVDGDCRRLRTHGDEAAKRSGAPASQWHVRLVELPRSMDESFTVAGNVHYDPTDHGKIGQYVGGVSWRFADARTEITDDWEAWGFPTGTLHAGNDDGFGSSQGSIGVVKPL